MTEHPRDVIIERVGGRFFVGYRDRSKMGMGVGTYAEARRWAAQMAATGSGRIIERTTVKAHASRRLTRRHGNMTHEPSYRVGYLGAGARRVYLPGFQSLAGATKDVRRLKRRGMDAWVEDERGAFVPIVGVKRQPGYLP